MTAAPSLCIVEDSPDDYQAVERTLKKLSFAGNLLWHSTGEEALSSLAEACREGRPPALVLLDLNLPGMDGRALLRELKSDPLTRAIPVIIYTTSDSQADIAYCYQHLANSYHVKPLGAAELRTSLQMLLTYWFSEVRLVR